ncbi:MAG: sugar phosphate isomerase/epimerase family protein [Clostridiaceae bacterium]|nr:sugar phosphate isomerase/epimerase family protein [Clostridiaceae bacterium]
MKLATTTADFKEYVTDPNNVGDILPLFKDTGFHYIDANFCHACRQDSIFAGDAWITAMHEAAWTARELGCRFIQAHASDTVWETGLDREETIGFIKHEIEACAILGIPQIVVHAVYSKGNTWTELRRANKQMYESLLPIAEKTGVTILLENSCSQNCGGMYFLHSAGLLLTLIEDMGCHPLTGVCWDVGHAHMQGCNQYAEIMELGSQLKAVHIHDNLGDRDVHLQPYTGNCAYDPIVKGLVDCGYKGYFTMEANSIPSPRSSIGRRGFTLDHVLYDNLVELPLSLKQMSERLMYETGKYMLDQYHCFEE